MLEGYKVAKEIAQHGAGASTFADFWGYKIEAYDAIPYNAALMTRAGILVSINSDSDERARRLNIEAAKMMKYGDLSEEEALKLITLNPAKQLGIEDRVGSLDVGKDADLVIWSGHPFSVYSRVENHLHRRRNLLDASKTWRAATRLTERRSSKGEPNRPPREVRTNQRPAATDAPREDDDMWNGKIRKDEKPSTPQSRRLVSSRCPPLSCLTWSSQERSKPRISPSRARNPHRAST